MVALYPLDADDFPVQPAITNYGKVRKHRRLPPVKLPNASAAFIDLRKLRDYSLSGTHPEGKHKARVFFAALGIGAEDAEWLRIELLAAAAREECTIGELSVYGQRYSVEFHAPKKRAGGSGVQRLDRTERRGIFSFDLVLCDMRAVVQNVPAKLLDVVALLEDQPTCKLVSGQVGTLVEVLAPDVFEVEFLDSEGRTLGFAELKRADLLVLRHDPALAV